MLTVTYAQCHTKVPYAECHTKAPYAECHYGECRHAECHGALAVFCFKGNALSLACKYYTTTEMTPSQKRTSLRQQRMP